MLFIAKSLKELDFRRLMAVYIDGNRENAREQYSHLPPEQGIAEAEQDFYAFLHRGFFRTPGAFYAIWLEEDNYVSALRMEPYRDGWLIEAVETAPDARRRGFGTWLLRSALAYLGSGRVYAHIGRGNEPSRRLHEGCGFRKISDLAVYIDGSVNSHCGTYLRELP